jgi:amino acid transporter
LAKFEEFSHTTYNELHEPMRYVTSRPRVLGWLRSAAILDGDWGTSICYVLGIAFTLAGYSGGLHLGLMLILTGLVSINYITICRLYPEGGGVYSSVRHRSANLAVIGALLLAADYIVTVALSVLDACHYIGFENPQAWAIVIILGIGILNWFGPRHAGSVALWISFGTIAAILIIIFMSVPAAFSKAHLAPLSGGVIHNWGIFVGIILSISGIESVSNMTGVMRDPARTSRNAILSVLTKVVVATVFLSLAMFAVPGLQGHTEDMIRYLGEFYVGDWFGFVVGIILGMLLISAGNTAVAGLISLQFLMAVDAELPVQLRRLNKHGVPEIPVLIAAGAPIVVLMVIHDVLTLSQLYAIGVVGAVLINVASTGTDRSLGLRRLERIFMVISAVVLLAVEASIAIEKHKALIFASVIILLGLGARKFSRRRKLSIPVPEVHPAEAAITGVAVTVSSLTSKFLVAYKGGNEKLLRFAAAEAKQYGAELYVLQIKEVSVGFLPENLPDGSHVNAKAIEEVCGRYDVESKIISMFSNEVGYTIAENAAMLGVDRVILGTPRRTMLERALKGNVIETVANLLPEEIQLLIFAG